jgi:Holliday junction resolvase-like predicted endonuclease
MRKVIRRQIRRKQGEIDIAADVNAVIAVNEGKSSRTVVSSRQRAEAGEQPQHRPDEQPPPPERDDDR